MYGGDAKPSSISFVCFFFNDTATTEIYTLSLHDALPISGPHLCPSVFICGSLLLPDHGATLHPPPPAPAAPPRSPARLRSASASRIPGAVHICESRRGGTRSAICVLPRRQNRGRLPTPARTTSPGEASAPASRPCSARRPTPRERRIPAQSTAGS